jgi:hypothetical protein
MTNKDSMLGNKRPVPDASPNASARMGGLSVAPTSRIESPKPQEVKLMQLLPQLAKQQENRNQPNIGVLPKLLTQETPKFTEMLKPDISASVEGRVSPKFTEMLKPKISASVEAKVSPMNVKIAPQENIQPEAITIAESILQKENIKKALDTNIQKSKEEQMSRQTINKLQPAFQRIEEILSYQGQLNKAKMDFNSEHYTVAASQSLFNLTANQIGNMPTWRQ